MNKKFTLIIAALFLAGIYSSCKKDAVSVEKKQISKLNTAVLARQMVADLQKSFSSQILQGNQTTAGLKTFNDEGCGVPNIYKAENTSSKGDTTEVYARSYFYRMLCSENNGVFDGFAFNDTSKTVQTGPGFVNTYINTYYHNAKGPNWNAMVVDGKSTIGQNLRKVNAQGVTSEFHDFNTMYTYTSMIVNPHAEGSKFINGRVDFVIQTIDLSPEIPAGIWGGNNGFIYYTNNTARIYFRDANVQGGYVRYIYDFASAQMTGPVNSYPFPVDMN